MSYPLQLDAIVSLKICAANWCLLLKYSLRLLKKGF